jgi:hypothetical protein
MGLGKITRGLGKVGLAFEALGYVVTGGKALVRAIKGAPGARRYDVEPRQEPPQDSRGEVDVQG